MITIDIETVPSGEKLNPEEISPPSNYKDEVKIKAYQEANVDKEFLGRALVPHKCQVVCVCARLENGRRITILDVDEETLILNFEDFLKQELNTPYEAQWTGVNVRSFDLVILKQRAWKYHCEWLSTALDQKVVDIMDVFTGSKYKDYLVSKDDMCRFFNIPVEGDSGAQVYGWWVKDDHKSIIDHCVADVNKEHELAKRLNIL